MSGLGNEVCDRDGLDEDCDPDTIYNDAIGANDGDRDGDGFAATECFNRRDDGTENRGTDCDDTRATINPGAVESCNGFDDNCDERVDEGVRLTFYRDVDGDGYGVEGDTFDACSRPAGYSLMPGDCDDGQTGTHPGATEVCNGTDDDCDSVADEAGATGTTRFYRDDDGDGYGTSEYVDACSAPVGYAEVNGDCWDDAGSASAPVHPGASYSAQPYCRSGRLCSLLVAGRREWHCNTSSASACFSSDPLPSWDYDCSGVVNVEPAADGACTGNGVTTPCRGGTGPTSGTTADCGQDVTYMTGCGGSGSCHPLYATMPLRCR